MFSNPGAPFVDYDWEMIRNKMARDMVDNLSATIPGRQNTQVHAASFALEQDDVKQALEDYMEALRLGAPADLLKKLADAYRDAVQRAANPVFVVQQSPYSIGSWPTPPVAPPPVAPEPEPVPTPAKVEKAIHEMRFADYQRGVDAWWPNRKRDW